MKMESDGLPRVEIRSEGDGTEVYIDGKRLNGVLSFSLEHDPMKNLAPVLSLRMECCKFDVSLGAVPLLPEPWKWFYEPKFEGLTDEETICQKKSADGSRQTKV